MSFFKKDRKIESVWGHVWHMTWQEHRTMTMVTVLLSVLTIVLFPLPLFIAGLYFGAFYLKATRDFYMAFAKKFGMEYRDTTSLDTLSGTLFEIGSLRHPVHVLSGTINNHPVRIFNYSFSQSSGKHSSTRAFTVFEIAFDKTRFPYILLNSNSMTRSYGLWGEKELPLELEFQQNYHLFSKEGYEIEVFQILTPKVLRFLSQKMPEMSIEFAGNKVLFYDDKSIGNLSDLQRIYNAIEDFLVETSNIIENLHDDLAVLHPYYQK